MDKTINNDIEVAPRSVVLKSANEFAQTLGETPQFTEFLKSHFDFRQDVDAQNIQQEYQKKQASLKAVLMLNAASDEDRKELQNLQERFNQRPSVIRFIKAQDDLIAICQEIGDLLSKEIGMDYASSCRTGGCCG
ncbi:MAG: YlbF family regulator [Anaerolineaceae bacterium]